MKVNSTIITNGTILVLLIGFVCFVVLRTMNTSATKRLAIQEEVQYDDPIFEKISSQDLPFVAEAFFADDNYLYMAHGKTFTIHNLNGDVLKSHETSDKIQDILLVQRSFYILHEQNIEVLSRSGQQIQTITSPNKASMLTSITSLNDTLYVSDRGQFKILKFDLEGKYHGTIESPYQFIAPSGFMALTNQDSNHLWCVNPGRHQLEKYSADGTFVASFGAAGAKPGSFSGCCNPCYIQVTETGDLITSEKGIPRVSLYSNRGIYLGHILATKGSTEGHQPMLIQYQNQILYIIHQQQLMKFQSSIDQY